MSQEESYNPYALPRDQIMEPPTSLWKALLKIGPGIILAGSIVGTGELIVTTGLGATYGFTLLWLILFSCVIKVFVQIELGRIAISTGKPTLGFLNDLPGPRIARAHWQVWVWFIMLLLTVTQLGGMCAGVGQALHLAFPNVSNWIAANPGFGILTDMTNRHPNTPWSILTAFAALALLLTGGYKNIEKIATTLVVSLTILTMVAAIALQWTEYPISGTDLVSGFKFAIPAGAIAQAFACFGITGVGASELYSYPYWCLEKGYARYSGVREDSDKWASRARGWMRVMQMDAWVSMIVFTVATVSFYFMGASVLNKSGLTNIKSDVMVQTLSMMFINAFGPWTRTFFLVGACAVLFKTLYVASAGHSRLTSDFLSLAGFVRYPDAKKRAKFIRGFCVFYPLLALVWCLFVQDPKLLVTIGAIAQAITLPFISIAAVWLRFKRLDRRIAPGKFWDCLLIFATISVTVFAAWSLYDRALVPLFNLMNAPAAE